MRVLAISTPSKYVSVSVADIEIVSGRLSHELIAEFSLRGARSEDLVSLMDRSFSASNTDLDSVGLVCVVQGPGSYSGLRGGLAAAKAIAQVRNIPIVGVSALEVIARELSYVEGTIAAVLDAVKDEYNLALFAASGGRISRLSEDTVMKKDALARFFDGFRDKVHVISPWGSMENVSVNDNMVHVKGFARAVNAGIAGFELYNNGGAADPMTMVPHYSHTPNIKEYGR